MASYNPTVKLKPGYIAVVHPIHLFSKSAFFHNPGKIWTSKLLNPVSWNHGKNIEKSTDNTAVCAIEEFSDISPYIHRAFNSYVVKSKSTEPEL